MIVINIVCLTPSYSLVFDDLKNSYYLSHLIFFDFKVNSVYLKIKKNRVTLLSVSSDEKQYL